MLKFSFIIPVYNCKDTLLPCINSILNITTERVRFCIEIILVNDGSSDGSNELCDSFLLEEKESVEIRVFHQHNKGVSAARNKGIHSSTGDYIIFIDSDDTIETKKMRQLLQLICDNHSIDMAVYGISFDYYLKGRCYRKDEMLPALSGTYTRNRWEPEMLSLYQSNALSSLCNRIINKNIIQKEKMLLDESMIILEDLEFTLRCLNHCDKILFCPETIYHYYHIGHNDHAGKRLLRISHISDVIDKIDYALQPFRTNLKPEIINQILTANYSNLLSAKISFSRVSAIKNICFDFKSWIDENGLFNEISQSNYLVSVYKQKSVQLYYKSRKSKIRHHVANYVKYIIGDFRKWKR